MSAPAVNSVGTAAVRPFTVPVETGWGPDRMARAWTELMRRLGYTGFVAQGGDWGAIVTDLMAVQAPPELLGPALFSGELRTAFRSLR
jgi:pimeloyl-ACP methyl ester carboxylesterase